VPGAHFNFKTTKTEALIVSRETLISCGVLFCVVKYRYFVDKMCKTVNISLKSVDKTVYKY